MQSNIISVDLAKNVFEVAVANHQHRIVARHRLSRAKFASFLAQHQPATVLFESCGTAQGRQQCRLVKAVVSEWPAVRGYDHDGPAST